MSRLALPLAFFLVLVLSPVARADEELPAPGTEARVALEHLDLLPLDEFQRADLLKEHPKLAQQVQGLAYRVRQLEGQWGRREKKDDEEGKKLAAEIARLREQAEAPLAELTALLRPRGLTDGMIHAMRLAPEGPGRVERYAHRLVLLLGDLDPAQRAIFERVVPEVDGAYLAAQALADRTELALKQSGLEPRDVRGILDGFRRQTNVVESRFWLLVDYALHDHQKAALWDLLPGGIRQHSSAEEHVYALPTLSPTQGARVKALVTEVEAESAPDQALVSRLRAELNDKSLSKEAREALQKEQREAYQRLNDLKRYAYEAVKDILTPAQVHLMKATPPRVSINDRRQDGRRVLQGMTFDAAQLAALDTLRQEGAEAARAHQARMKALYKDTGETGPDSPQMAMMEMMMMGARGEVQTAQRHLLGRAFREVLTPQQVSGWVVGLYGDRR